MAYTSEEISGYLAANPGMTDAQIASAMQTYGVTPEQVATATGVPLEQVQSRYEAATAPTSALEVPGPLSSVTDKDIFGYFQKNPNLSDTEIASAMQQYNVTPEQVSRAMNVPLDIVQPRYESALSSIGLPKENVNPLIRQEELVKNAFKTIGMEGIGSEMGQINPEHYNYFLDQLKSGAISPEQFEKTFKQDVRSYTEQKPEDPYSKYALSKIGDITQYAPRTVPTRFGDTNTDILLKLAGQIVPNLGELKGGIYGTRGESVGFGFDEATRILGREPQAVEQVILDMARNLMNQGVTDLNQLKVKDVYEDVRVNPLYDEFGRPLNKYSVSIPTGYESYATKELTPEEVAKIKDQSVNYGEGLETFKTINLPTGKGLYANDKLLTSATGGLDTLNYSIGETYSGPGMTGYNIVINPLTGQPQFSTFGSDTGQKDLISFALTAASFIPGVAPFAQGASALWAIDQGNYIGAAATLASMGAGFSVPGSEQAANLTNIATGLRAADAVQRKDPLALAAALISNKTIAGDIGGTKLGGTNVTLSDVGNAAALAAAFQSGNISAMMNAAMGLAKSTNPRTAAAGARAMEAINSGDSSVAGDIKSELSDVFAASEYIATPEGLKQLAQNAIDSKLIGSGYSDINSAVYDAAIQSGVSEEEARNAAQSVATALQAPDTSQTSATLPGVVVSPETEGKEVYYPGDETELYRIDENYNIIEKATNEIVGVVGENVRGTVEPKRIDITGTSESETKEGNTATSFLDRLSNLRSIFSVGTPPAVGSGYSLFGSGASGTSDNEFVLIARDDPKQAIVWLENKVQEITNNPQTTEEQKVQIAQEAEKLKTEIEKTVPEQTPQTSTTGGGGGGGGTAPSELKAMEEAGTPLTSGTTASSQEQTQTQLPVLTSPEGTWTVPEATSQVATPGITSKDIVDFLKANPGMSDQEILSAMQTYNITPQQLAEATGVPLQDVQTRYDAALAAKQTETPGYTTEPGTGGGTGGGEGTGTGTGTGTGAGTGAGTGTGEGTGTGGGYGAGTGSGAGTTPPPSPTPKVPTLPKTIPQMLAANQMMREWELPKPREIPYTPDVKLFQDMYEFAMAPIPQSQPQLAQLVQEQFFDYIDDKKKKDEEERKKQESLFYYGREEEEPQTAKEGGLIGHNPEFYSEGGTSALGNRYVRGGGDGTSDSVPAMLASGEFVIPADVVSNLGNGDNEAGAQTLDKFMEVIRAHKRSAHPSELPEDSKGPLAYLQEALVKSKGKKHGRTK